MKHLIIGSGTVGVATGFYLESIGEEVIFNDKDKTKLKKLSGHNTSSDINVDCDIFWVCTHEKDVAGIISLLSKKKRSIVVIRSTTPIGTIDALIKKYDLEFVAHNPEFLREKTAIHDVFNPDRIVIGTHSEYVSNKLLDVYSSLPAFKYVCTPLESEIIKYTANCWLATQISFWNEMKLLYDTYKINGQGVVNTVCLDRRISKYGSNLLGVGYSGMCLPKDMRNMIKAFKDKKLDPILLSAVEERNKCLQQKKD